MGLPRPKNCNICGVTYRKNNENYCSRTCYNVGRLKDRHEADCLTCGKHFVSKLPKIKYLKAGRALPTYCSTACRVRGQTKGKIESPCKVCGKIRMIYPSDVALGRGNYCSKKCLGTTIAGANHPNWNNGSTMEREQERKSVRYKEWRTSVFIRDGRACVWCGSTKQIEADHIKPWALYPALRYELSNGRTLCHECHTTTPSYFNSHYKEEPELI
jgi:5-methylcytosine-specific restriction endonuclease McrA